MASIIPDLEAEYSPYVDSALLLAIASDYDLTDPIALRSVRSALTALKQAALEVENSQLDGLNIEEIEGYDPDELDTHGHERPPQTSSAVRSSESHDADSSSTLSDATDDDTKVAILQELFPEFSPFSVAHTLKKGRGDLQRAIDDLLNQQYLAEVNGNGDNGLAASKGIEAFLQDHDTPRRRGRKRGERNGTDRRRSSSVPAGLESHSTNAWLLGGHRPDEDEMTLVPQYAALSLTDDEHEPDSMSLASSTTPHSTLAKANSAAYRSALAQAQAAYRRSKSDRLMGGAAAYYSELGRSHASAARGHGAAAADVLVASSSTAESIDLHGASVQDAVRISKARVNQWWANLGENKVNGRLGAGARAQGFTIIVGIGRHSEGGRSKLGPAVKQALAAEGWRVEAETGHLVVKGKQKR